MRVRYPTREGILRDEAETVGGLRLIGVCAEDEACLVHWVATPEVWTVFQDAAPSGRQSACTRQVGCSRCGGVLLRRF